MTNDNSILIKCFVAICLLIVALITFFAFLTFSIIDSKSEKYEKNNDIIPSDTFKKSLHQPILKDKNDSVDPTTIGTTSDPNF